MFKSLLRICDPDHLLRRLRNTAHRFTNQNYNSFKNYKKSILTLKMNRILRVRSLVPSIRANFSSTARRDVFRDAKEHVTRQQTMQGYGRDVHHLTAADKMTFPATMLLCVIGFGVTVNRCLFLAYKK